MTRREHRHEALTFLGLAKPTWPGGRLAARRQSRWRSAGLLVGVALGCAIAAGVLALLGVGNGWTPMIGGAITLAVVLGVARAVGHFRACSQRRA